MENLKKFFIVDILDSVWEFLIDFIESPIGLTFGILFITFALLVCVRSLLCMR